MYRKRVAVKNTAALIDFYGNVHYNFFIRLIEGLEITENTLFNITIML